MADEEERAERYIGTGEEFEVVGDIDDVEVVPAE